MASKDFEHTPNDNRYQRTTGSYLASGTPEGIHKPIGGSVEENKPDDGLNLHRRGIKSGHGDVSKRTDPLPEQLPLILPSELASTVPAEDAQAAEVLWRENPALSPLFTRVIEFLQLFVVQPTCYQVFTEMLFEICVTIQEVTIAEGSKVADFAGLLGFAAKSFSLYKQGLQEEGVPFLARAHDETSRSANDVRVRCLLNVRNVYWKFSNRSAKFCMFLAQSGALPSMLEDLRYLYRHSGDELVESTVFLQSIGCVHNCLRFPDSHCVARRMDIVQHLSPFLKHLMSKVRLMVLIPLALVMDDDDNELLFASGDVLVLFLEQLELSWKSERHHHDYWCVEELLQSLRHLVKLDTNKRRLREKGLLRILTPILRDGSDLEKMRAAGVMWELAFDEDSSRDLQSNYVLLPLLENLRDSGQPAVSDKASKTLWTLRQSGREDDNQKTPEEPVVDELLQPLQNAMEILGVGPIEMIINKLNAVHRQDFSRNMGGPQFCSRERLLKGVLELIRKDGKNAAESVRKGLLTQVRKILRSGKAGAEEKQCLESILQTLVRGNHIAIDDQDFLELERLLSVMMKTGSSDTLHFHPNTSATRGKGLPSRDVTEDQAKLHTSGQKLSVYISCHPSDRAVVLKVRNHLQRQHYNVHLSCDVSSEGASPALETVTLAVRNSCVLLMCLSSCYKASAHCRMEAEYAAKQGKKLVAVYVEADYKPSGWLASLLNKAKTVVDITDMSCLEQQLSSLHVTLESFRGEP